MGTLVSPPRGHGHGCGHRHCSSVFAAHISSRVLQLCGQGLPCVSDTGPLPRRALEATLNADALLFCVPLWCSQELEEVKKAAYQRSSEVYVEMSDWALQTSGMDTSSPVSLVCSTPQRSLGCRRCSPKWGSLNASRAPSARLWQRGALRLPPGPALGLRAGASGAAPARIPVLMEGLSSSPLRLKRERPDCPLLPSALVCCHSRGHLLSPRTLRPSPADAVREAVTRHMAAVIPLRSWAPPAAWP